MKPFTLPLNVKTDGVRCHGTDGTHSLQKNGGTDRGRDHAHPEPHLVALLEVVEEEVCVCDVEDEVLHLLAQAVQMAPVF